VITTLFLQDKHLFPILGIVMTTCNELLSELNQRGLIAQTTEITQLHEHLNDGHKVIYCGFDPTAGSLHIGHLVPLLLLKRFANAGHKVIALIGGATGMIGDPSFKATERTLNSDTTVENWVNSLSVQISGLFVKEQQAGLFQTVNNADWMTPMNVLAFLRDVGKHFSVNAMIAKDSVKQRLERPDQGISFTEFAYSLLQSYDFAVLNKLHDCTIQLGGNDQWGNITSGIDLTRRLNQHKVFGITVPLITKTDGTKFGKTESGAIWLDPLKTSPYAFYQFWLNTTDVDVYRFLRYYTFLSPDKIDALEHADQQRNKPEAQIILAQEMTRLIHGEAALSAVEHISHSLFTNNFSQLTQNEFEQLEQDGIPTTETTDRLSLSTLLVKTGLATSNRQAREFIQNGAVAVNGEIFKNDGLTGIFPLHDRYLVLKRGKKQFHLVKQI
jgi:tyrosyl-tRNA synthetase